MQGIVFILTLCLQFIVCEKKGNEKNLVMSFDTTNAILNFPSFSTTAHTTSACNNLYSKNATKNVAFEGSEQENVLDFTVCFSHSST